MNDRQGPRRGRSLLLSTTSLLILVPASVAAQEATRLDGIVVSSSRIETPAAAVGSAISSISGEELQRRQIRRIEDALDLLPGVTVRRPGGIGNPAAVSIRGLGPRNTLILLDGVEIGDTSRSQVAYEFGTIPVEDVERIEVLRGPQSTLYGSDASGGVVNIITKRPTKPYEGYARLEGGSYGTVESAAGVRGKVGRFTYGASAFGFQTDGISAFSKNRGGKELDGHETYSGRADLGYEVTDNLRISAWASQSEAKIEYDQSNMDLIDQWFTKRERFARGQAVLDTLGGKWRHTAGISHSTHERDFKGAQNPQRGDQFDGTKTKVDYLGDLRIAPGHRLVTGLESEWDTIDQVAPAFANTFENGVIDANARTSAGFVEYRATLFDSAFLTAGARHDEHDRFGGATTWRLTAAYLIQPTETKLRASYGTGFVTPSLFEMFDPCLGNRNLKAEKSKGWDAGIDQYLWGDRVVITGTYFDSKIDDQIRFDFSRPQPQGCAFDFGGYLNVEKVHSKGVELEVRAKLDKDLFLRGHYTYIDARNAITGERLRDVPWYQGAVALDWRFMERASAGATVRFRGEAESGFGTGQRVGDFATLDLRAAYQVTDAVSIYGRVVNLFDADYEEIYGIGTPGISAYAGVRVRW